MSTNEEIDIFVRQIFAVKGVLNSDDVQKSPCKAKEYLDNNHVLLAWNLHVAKGN